MLNQQCEKLLCSLRICFSFPFFTTLQYMSSICTKWWKSQPWKTCSFISLVKELRPARGRTETRRKINTEGICMILILQKLKSRCHAWLRGDLSYCVFQYMDLDSVSSSITHVRILTLSGWSPFDVCFSSYTKPKCTLVLIVSVFYSTWKSCFWITCCRQRLDRHCPQDLQPFYSMN